VHARIADLVDALAGSERFQLDLRGQDTYFLIIK
jgi:hypothetical protein